MAQKTYTSKYSGSMIDELLSKVSPMEQTIDSIQENLGDNEIGTTVKDMQEEIDGLKDSINKINNNSLPSKVDISDYNVKMNLIDQTHAGYNTRIDKIDADMLTKASATSVTTLETKLTQLINDTKSNYEDADADIYGKIEATEQSLNQEISDLKSTTQEHSKKIESMEEKVNSTQTEANITEINNRLNALEEDRATVDSLNNLSEQVLEINNQVTENKGTISNLNNSIENLELNKVNNSTFAELNTRVTTLEEDTTTAGLTSQIEGLQQQIAEILEEITKIKNRLDILETPTPAE